MRREDPTTHAAHREEQHHAPHTHTEEPRKRSYERVIDGEDPLPDDSPDQVIVPDTDTKMDAA